MRRTADQSFEQELSRVLGKERTQEIIAERNARIERKRSQQRGQRDRLKKLRTLADVMQIMQAEKEARLAKKEKKRHKRKARQRQVELRMYARYVNEGRQQRREADRRRMAIARRHAQDANLAQERDSHRSRVTRIEEKGHRVPTTPNSASVKSASGRL